MELSWIKKLEAFEGRILALEKKAGIVPEEPEPAPEVKPDADPAKAD